MNTAFTIVHSKIKFEYLNPRPETILIEDIAHALSHICRFTGHTIVHYSVAQHSCFVSDLVSQPNKFWGLMHDAPETYMNDLSHQLKGIIDGHYAWIHDNIMRAICNKFGLPLQEPEEVELLDHVLAVNELQVLIDDSYLEDGVPKLFDEIIPWSAERAKVEFLKRFDELKVLGRERVLSP